MKISRTHERDCRPTSDFESSPDAYSVKLDSFEGPLDLLIHLIKKNEVNIYDIPIALITQQYLEYVEMMKELEPRHRRRVPGDGGDADSHQVEDAAAAARVGAAKRSRKRIRARRWCAGCSSIRSSRPPPSCCTSGRCCAARSGFGPDGRIAEIAGDEYAYEPEVEVDLFSLLAAFRGVLERAKQRPKMLLPPEEVPVEVRIDQLLAMLSETEACGFEDLFAKDDTRARDDHDISRAAGDDSP